MKNILKKCEIGIDFLPILCYNNYERKKWVAPIYISNNHLAHSPSEELVG